MMIGNPSTFAVESGISIAYERLSQRALGFFALHVNGRCYGVRTWDATMLAVSFDEIGRRIAARARHNASVISNFDATDLAAAYSRALYVDHEEDELFFGMPDYQFRDLLYSNRLVWDGGDEAFDDSSHVLQFDIEDKVRVIAFSRSSDPILEPGSLREVWLSQDDFYGTLQSWHDSFRIEWESLPKSDNTNPYIQ